MLPRAWARHFKEHGVTLPPEFEWLLCDATDNDTQKYAHDMAQLAEYGESFDDIAEPELLWKMREWQRNGKPVDWALELNKPYLTPREAVCLAHGVSPGRVDSPNPEYGAWFDFRERVGHYITAFEREQEMKLIPEKLSPAQWAVLFCERKFDLPPEFARLSTSLQAEPDPKTGRMADEIVSPGEQGDEVFSDEDVIAVRQEIKGWYEGTFDGFLGEVPDTISSRLRDEFYRARTKVLAQWSPEQAKTYIECFERTEELQQALGFDSSWLECFKTIKDMRLRLGYGIPETSPKDSTIKAALKRGSQWHELVWRAFLKTKELHRTTSAKLVERTIRDYYRELDTERIIQEIEGDTVCWRSRYGNEDDFKFSSLPSLLSRLKNNPPF